MISKLLTPRQRAAFMNHRLARWSLYLLLVFVALSVFAEFVANSKPLVMRHNGQVYFPVVQHLTPKDLGLETTTFEVNYRELLSSQSSSWALWPIVPFDPYESDRNLERYPSPPDKRHWLGTDDRGRDVLARLVYGLRNSLSYAVAVWILSYAIGIFLGGIQGYLAGKTDFYIQRGIEIINAIPALFLLIILISVLKPSLWLLIVFSASLAWISISYYVRAEFLKLRALDFVEAARALGVSRPRLLWKHMLPNALTPVITFSPFALTAGITGLAGLDYLGFGLAPPAASWGELLNQAQKHFDHAWWLAVFPASALMITLVCLNLIGEGLRTALDPKNGR